MTQRLKGKVAVVTGSGNGIGRCVALDLAREAAQVIVTDLEENAAVKVSEEINKSKGSAIALRADVALMEDNRRIIETAVEKFGRIDIVVCCAGTCITKGVEETTEEEWDQTMAIHLKGPFGVIHYAVPYMKRQKSGRIITVSSRGGLGWGRATFTAYTAAKAGILGLTIILARELGEYGITVNSLLPSAVTRLFPWDRKALGDGIPAEKSPSPESCSPLAVYLTTDEADYINGQYFYVSGGNIALYSSIPKPIALLHTPDKWSVDELARVLPEALGESIVNPSPPQVVNERIK